MMMQRAVVTPIATETGASVPSGTSDSENETRHRNNNSRSNSFWKKRRLHNPSTVPIPLLDATPPRRKGQRRHRREDPLKQPSTSADESISLVSPRTLVAMFLIMVVCVVLEVILVESFFFGDNNRILRASGRSGKHGNLLHELIPNNKYYSSTKTADTKNETDAVSISVVPPPSIAASTTSTTSTTDWNLRARHRQRRAAAIDEIETGSRT
jgi:hypothetical protein